MSARRFKPYPAYKDSGVEWLGEIPAHWRALALKRIGGLQAGVGFPDDEQGLTTEELPFFKVGDMGATGNEREMRECQHTVSRATARRLRAFVFPPGTIVFAKVGAALMLNRRRLLTRPSCIDNNMMGFMPGESDRVWAMYWLNGLDMGELANPGAVPSVNEGQMRDTPAAVPPPPEQRAIAAYLDRETARIDTLAAKNERLIELLQEKRTALITRAVTKGLDPTVPMKDSGVEWLGKIPAHWEVGKLRRFWSVIDCKHRTATYVDDGVPIVSTTEVKPGRMTLDGPRKVAMADFDDLTAGGRRPRRGDLVYSRNASLGSAAYVETDEPFCMGQDVCLITSDANQLYLGYQLNSPVVLAQIEAVSVGSTFERINIAQIKDYMVACPPRTEQGAIATLLDKHTSRIDALIAKVRDAIERLKELRNALISAAVTGKIDVREEGA